ncbi:MAG: InlB B-repeat-containing protein, partial [Clostridiales Family XIII bacterium]|nr:InlB B-repeat-containing protein [Clostridiales Family XIII bacterium]
MNIIGKRKNSGYGKYGRVVLSLLLILALVIPQAALVGAADDMQGAESAAVTDETPAEGVATTDETPAESAAVTDETPAEGVATMDETPAENATATDETPAEGVATTDEAPAENVVMTDEAPAADKAPAPLLADAGAPIPITLSTSLTSNDANGYAVSGNTLTFNANAKGKAYIISQNTGHKFTTITVLDNVSADITINSISINSFALSSGANVNLFLKGSSTMSLGVRVPPNATVSIDDNGDNAGKLTVSRGIGNAGQEGDIGVINIKGGTIIANNNNGYAGIGSASNSSNGTINISGGIITARGGYDAAGIGTGGIENATGHRLNSTRINISGGDITAYGGGNASGIGGGWGSSGGIITITNGTVNAYGSYLNYGGGAGIGGGYQAEGGVITISGGTVNASCAGNPKNTPYAAGIGGGTDAAGGTIIISGGTVNATAIGGAAIGMGADELNDGNQVNTTNIKISGDANVTATSTGAGAAIGGGRRYGGGTIEISGDANVTATGGNSAKGGAGIGRGYDGGNGANLTLASTATVKAYSMNTGAPAIDAESISGDAFFVNAQIDAARTADIKLKAYGPDGYRVNTALSLPENYPNFAYTTGSAQPRENYILAFNNSTNICEGMIAPTENNTSNAICTVSSIKGTSVTKAKFQGNVPGTVATSQPARDAINGDSLVLNNTGHNILSGLTLPRGSVAGFKYGASSTLSSGAALASWDSIDSGPKKAMLKNLEPNTEYSTRTYIDIAMGSRNTSVDASAIVSFATSPKITTATATQGSDATTALIHAEFYKSTLNSGANNAPITDVKIYVSTKGISYTEGFASVKAGGVDVSPVILKKGTDYTDAGITDYAISNLAPDKVYNILVVVTNEGGKDGKLFQYRGDNTLSTVSYNSNNPIGASASVTGSMYSQTEASQSAGLTLSPNVFKLRGYNFLGWNTARFGGGESYANGCTIAPESLTSNLTLFAQWQLKDVTVTYYRNDETDSIHGSQVIVGYNSRIVGAPTDVPSREGYLFAGWCTESGTEWAFGADGTAVDEAHGVVITDDVTATLSLYAKWVLCDFTLTANDGKPLAISDYSLKDAILTIKSNRALTIGMASGVTSTATHRIAIDSSAGADITLKDVSIILPTGSYAPAFNVDGSTLNLTLKGTNVLTSGWNCAGLQLVNNANLVITEASDGGALTATCVKDAAGIGGGDGAGPAGNITINGGTVTARNTNGVGSAIGGGFNSSVGDVTINGGTINATVTVNKRGYGGAGIGGGYKSSAGNITINGGTVTASSGRSGSGIGGGGWGSPVKNITITGGTVTVGHVAGSTWGSGIGAGAEHSSAGDITISGGVVTAVGSTQVGSGIGAARSTSPAGVITISGGTVIAIKGGDAGSQDIGNGEDANSVAASVTITGGSVWAVNGLIAPAPKNAVENGASVYANKLDFAPALTDGAAFTAGNIDGTACKDTASAGAYGKKDIKAITDPTNADKKVRVCLWLPATTGAAGSVSLSTADAEYQSSYERGGSTPAPQTLVKISSTGDIPSGGGGEDKPSPGTDDGKTPGTDDGKTPGAGDGKNPGAGDAGKGAGDGAGKAAGDGAGKAAGKKGDTAFAAKNPAGKNVAADNPKGAVPDNTVSDTNDPNKQDANGDGVAGNKKSESATDS